MLEKIKIKNLAIIEDLEIYFNKNFTALTGATGAGKSLVIDSLKLIFGKRADSDYIRYNEDEAVLTAIFKDLNKEVKDYLKTLSLFDETLTIERTISKKDRNKITVNDKLITLTELKELGLLLGDIHEQHDTQKLLDEKTALLMVDELGKTKETLNQYVILRYNFLEAKEKYEKALKKTSETNELLDDLKYQLEELEKANLVVGETKELEETIVTLTNQKEIIESLNSSYKNIKAISDENTFYDVVKNLESISEYSPVYKDLKERVNSLNYELEDLKVELYKELSSIYDYKLEELEDLQDRYYFLLDLEKKYNLKIEKLINYQEDLKEEILKVENYDLFLDKLKKDKIKAQESAYEKGLELREKRQKTAKNLEKEFVQVLLRLAIDYVDFQVSFKESENKTLKEDGIDEIEFLISLNEGEPVKPFYKVASGGELSRSMLALKILYGKIYNLSLMVFDEIDLGISGDAASKVANELFKLKDQRQIITITHLPQVAAIAEEHYNIEKKVVQGRTTTIIKNLDDKQRVYYLAYMLSGKNITDGAISHAKALLNKEIQ